MHQNIFNIPRVPHHSRKISKPGNSHLSSNVVNSDRKNDKNIDFYALPEAVCRHNEFFGYVTYKRVDSFYEIRVASKIKF